MCVINISCYHLHVESKNQKKLMYITRQKPFHKYREQTGVFQWKEGREERQNRGMELTDINYYV